MINLKDSNARAVFHFFCEISKIPRGSGNTGAIADYLTQFAKAKGLEFYRDGFDNVIIKKPGTVGYEKKPAIILQGHTDMVLQKADGVTWDMEKNGVKPILDGDFIKAEGTTLGADDGIAVAYALALLDSSDISHPPIEAVFTSNEEIGLIGAEALDCSRLSGKMMINLDSDKEGVFIAGCAGGRRIDISLPISYEQADENKYTLIIDGLLGGHSGVMINKGRTNAIKRLCEYLSSFGNIKLISISGGVADNAIPPSAAAEFVSHLSLNELSEIAGRLKKSLDETSEKENITLALAGKANRVMTAKSSENLISLINDIPYGVIKMSEEIPDMTETSINLGIISTDGLRVNITTALRSSKDNEKERLAARVKEIGARYSADINEHGDYPGWEYKKDSHLRDIMCEIYRNMYNKDASVVTIHAGLECGLFSKKIEGLDCISMGPLAYDIHTPDEKLSVSSTERVWEYLKEVLKNI
ncbi:MAG: aminoacyl-histidine dipeptidase [Clostridia bacterium]|nr:aminoacyl-histidine dipeptidase [Clostridia bacterium]